MTAQQLLDTVMGLLGQPSENGLDYMDHYYTNLNAILGQTFKLENNNRQALGLTLLTTIPTVTSLSQTLTYQDNVLRNVVAYGIASKFAIFDEDDYLISYNQQQFVEGMQTENKVVLQPILDYYSDETL